MNTRVLELIKNPTIITESDLTILKSESEKMPYAQSVRALYLYGINLYQTESYKENLSKTAAYTTDKKILYQFINPQSNKKIDVTQAAKTTDIKQEIVNNTVPLATVDTNPIEENSVVVNKFDIDKIIESESEENPEYIVVDGEKNRLLYEGEENFLQQKSQEVDIEATKESGVITIKADFEEDNTSDIEEIENENPVVEIPKTETTEEFAQEETIVENRKETQIQDEDSSGDVSFNGIEDFLPQVKFSVPKNHLDYLNPPKKTNKTTPLETAKPQAVIKDYVEPKFLDIRDEEIDNSQISFENTQTFDITPSVENVLIEDKIASAKEEKLENNVIDEQAVIIDIKREYSNTAENIITEQKPVAENNPAESVEWKPMSFSSHTPDALIGKKTETEKPQIVTEAPIIKKEIVAEEKPITEEKKQTIETERPVMNVSFFDNAVSITKEEKTIPAILEKTTPAVTTDSNVGTFINTWQSWLKIDREESPQVPEKNIIIKEKIIDSFIEKNPKISQLKEEGSFVVKEKKDDISHLMTETLAGLYVEQRLYAKAIKAYELLSDKHPHKKDYFLAKIEEIKEIRKP